MLSLAYALFFCALGPLVSLAAASSHHHAHNKLHHRQEHNLHGARDTAIDDAYALVNASLPAIAAANKLKLQQPRFNTYQFPPAGNASSYGRSNTTVPVIGRRGHLMANGSSTSTGSVPPFAANSNTTSRDYIVSPELAKAARVVAEGTTNKPAGADYTDRAARLKAEHWGQTSPASGDNATSVSDGVEARAAAASSSFWMANMAMNGVAPYAAAANYKVWRNVMDYGAKGDGKTDDTVAINKAITDGGRCGQTCGSSTATPAVIYFPSGTYLVSDTLIMYYNTQFLGDPTARPTLLAAASFVGYAVVLTDVYIDGANGAEWYIPQSNFLRSVRNFVIDITNAPANNYVCGIHWQVAQGTDLQNIDFYMKDGTTQQGLYMENGSGGFMTDLYFQGGNFGAYLGNQQFTARNLIFSGCLTSIQVFWDWAWLLQGLTIIGDNTKNGPSVGITIVDGAGGSAGSTGQGVGSMIITDCVFYFVDTAIKTTLVADNSSSFLLQNSLFVQVPVAVYDTGAAKTLLAGSSTGNVQVASWGFGNIVSGTSGTSVFQNGNAITAPVRPASLLPVGSGNWFTRSAPTYADASIPATAIVNVKTKGAAGDGATDDTAALNQALAAAANASQIVFFPYGVYVVTDTLHIPLGSRIVGQAWSTIAGRGARFQDATNPRAVVQVGRAGDAGTVEISDMLFSVIGPTAGAVVVEWNVHEDTNSSAKGSAAMWNSHIRVGGNVGSSLQAATCPMSTSGTPKPACVAASLLFHLTPAASAYIENFWVWTADHDLDIASQDMINVYTGRGVLIESQGPTWLWGSASEHSVLYQYQFSRASNLFCSMLQTESPYFQPSPGAPAPFVPGMFPDDPTFADCALPIAANSRCALAWPVRILDSTDIFVYSAGLYSWFQSYAKNCEIGNNCQDGAMDIQRSENVWIYNLCTKAIVNMVTPLGTAVTVGRLNQNGFLASILGWLEGATTIVGDRFAGWSVFASGSLVGLGLSSACEAALYQTVKCDDSARNLLAADAYLGSTGNKTLTGLVCEAVCEASIAYVRQSVAAACAVTPHLPGTNVPFVSVVDRLWSNWNQTCFVDPTTGTNCNDVIAAFPAAADIAALPVADLCSYCYTQKLKLMEASAYSGAYDNTSFAARYAYVASHCSLTGVGNFNGTASAVTGTTPVDVTAPVCVSGKHYTVASGDTCDSIAVANAASSATLFAINPVLRDCSKELTVGAVLCLPQTCDTLWTVQPDDTCQSIGNATGNSMDTLVAYNTMLNRNCSNLQPAPASEPSWGATLCVSSPGGAYAGVAASNTSTDGNGGRGNGYAPPYTQPIKPPTGATVAKGTNATLCAAWYVYDATLLCAQICLTNDISIRVLTLANPSLHVPTCDADLVRGTAYCVRPLSEVELTASSALPSSSTASLTSTSTSATTSKTPSNTPNPISTDGKCGTASSKNATCQGSTFGNCCGPSGTCGSTPAFCSGRLGCQPTFGECKPISKDGTCGAASSVDALCLYSSFGDCCGASGKCGTTTAFCNTDEGCQSNYGTCVARVSTDGKCGNASSVDATCLGSTFGNCCGSSGTCGSTPAFCYGRLGCQAKYGNCVPISTDGKCGSASSVGAMCLYSAFGDCCSAAGTCGTTSAACYLSNGCQATYGTCLAK
ncbi:LysM domain protein [Sporothrix schenckii 1099-18]|uniref:LysM domain protein n=1 Tax=Sporothrix schenckii 1099-18 TaxID=1397361 RepID=A0A0F2MDU1_SPOSC|nr:LysM domain protein [Sporothrix schenckii 1099-18]KJR87858.1 LysM domain protein [Sporothrix schenckii 1099-18]